MQWVENKTCVVALATRFCHNIQPTTTAKQQMCKEKLKRPSSKGQGYWYLTIYVYISIPLRQLRAKSHFPLPRTLVTDSHELLRWKWSVVTTNYNIFIYLFPLSFVISICLTQRDGSRVSEGESGWKRQILQTFVHLWLP